MSYWTVIAQLEFAIYWPSIIGVNESVELQGGYRFKSSVEMLERACVCFQTLIYAAIDFGGSTAAYIQEKNLCSTFL